MVVAVARGDAFVERSGTGASPCAGLPVKGKHDQRFACVGIKQPGCSLRSTAPGRAGVNRCAIEHNRALPKVGQSLRRASLDGLPLRALRVRVMVGYVLRPGPDKGYVGVAALRLVYSGAARGWCGSLSRRRARALAGVAGGQFVVKVGAGGTATLPVDK